MPWKRLTLTSFIACTAMLTSACGTTSALRVSQIPLREDLTKCVALTALPSEALPALSDDPVVRAAQLQERGVWMRRDLEQTGIAREACNKQIELVALIQANNAGPSN